MKEDEVIKDFKKQKFILFAEKNDGSYGEVEGGSYLIENELDDFWFKKRHLEKTMREKLVNAEFSPVYYYMMLEDLTVSELASRAGIRQCKVKKHIKSDYFKKVTVEELKKYAQVFDVELSNFFQIILSSQDQNIKYHLYNEDENKKERILVKQYKTKNPYVVITKAEDNQ